MLHLQCSVSHPGSWWENRHSCHYRKGRVLTVSERHTGAAWTIGFVWNLPMTSKSHSFHLHSIPKCPLRFINHVIRWSTTTLLLLPVVQTKFSQVGYPIILFTLSIIITTTTIISNGPIPSRNYMNGAISCW
jgi:hypothetical protein